MSEFPEALWVSGSDIGPLHESWESIERDPRGVLLMWHPPRPGAQYIMGCDPTQGITGWSRATMAEGDHKIDNAAIEIFEVDAIREPEWMIDERGDRRPDIDPVTGQQKIKYRDLQVAEFAAPCDAVEAARVCNVLGRIYAGNSDDQCLLVHEAWPGPGMLTTQELLRLGYANLWHWEYIDSMAEETARVGWRSTRESQKLLWYRSRRHLMMRNAVLRSKWALDEYRNAEIDLDKMRARAAYGFHDDRFQACNMCFWAGHGWTYDVERTEEIVTTKPVLDPQRYAPTLDDPFSYKDWRLGATADWEG